MVNSEKMTFELAYQILSEMKGDDELVSAAVNFALGCMIFYHDVSKMPDCNTCLKKHVCPHAPKVGGDTRFNCPEYLGNVRL